MIIYTILFTYSKERIAMLKNNNESELLPLFYQRKI